MKITAFAALLLALVMPFSSCKKEKIDPETLDLLVQKLQSASDQTLAAVLDAVQQKIAELPELNSIELPSDLPVPTCPTVSTSGKTFPMTVTLDFGTSCTTKNGHVFSGSISMVASGKCDSTGSSIVLTINNLTVDGNKLSGAITIKNVGANGKAYQKMEFSATNLVLTNSEGKTQTLTQLDGTRTQTAGTATTTSTHPKTAFSDDEFDIEFSGKGVDAEGKNFTLETTAALHREFDCKYIVSGKIEYKTGLKTNSADYGNGACDNEVKVTVAGVTKTIYLP